MIQAGRRTSKLDKLLAKRFVRYADLKPCTTAFIDTRTPGRQQKENFTIIGPGVSENPDQYVHIRSAHGFNIGGARQPPGCINSQHSHKTAEVFIVHSGTWAFYLGPQCEDGEVVLGPGDTISIPTDVFRGFMNVGEESGFLFAVLGGDDPGRVTWAPDVFEKAREYGLVLLDDGSLVDTKRGEEIPSGKRAMLPTTADDVARARRMTAAQMTDCVVPHKEFDDGSQREVLANGLVEFPVIGAASESESIGPGKINWPHGFQLRYCPVAPGCATQRHSRSEAEVILLLEGSLTVVFDEGEIKMTAGDVLTIPIDRPRQFLNRSQALAKSFIVRGSDSPNPPRLSH